MGKKTPQPTNQVFEVPCFYTEYYGYFRLLKNTDNTLLEEYKNSLAIEKYKNNVKDIIVETIVQNETENYIRHFECRFAIINEKFSVPTTNYTVYKFSADYISEKTILDKHYINKIKNYLNMDKNKTNETINSFIELTKTAQKIVDEYQNNADQDNEKETENNNEEQIMQEPDVFNQAQENNVTLDQYKQQLCYTNFNDCPIRHFNKLLDERQQLLAKGCTDPLVQLDETDRKLNMPFLFKEITHWCEPQMDYESSRGTIITDTVVFQNNDSSLVYGNQFRNGNNGRTIVSKESLQPIMEYIKFVEERGGKAFIAGTYNHSDVFYYNVTTIFWK